MGNSPLRAWMMVGSASLCMAAGVAGQCEPGWNGAFTPTVFNGRVEGGVVYRGPEGADLVVHGPFRWDGGGSDYTLAAWDGRDWREVSSEFRVGGTVVYADPYRTPGRIIAGRTSDDVGIYEDGHWTWVEPPVSRGSFYVALTGPDGQSDDIYLGGSTYDPDRVSMLFRYDGEGWTDLGRGFGRSITDMEWFDDGSGVKLYATGQPPSYGDPDELFGFARLHDDGHWEVVAPERMTRPVHLCAHDDGSGPRLFGMNNDVLTSWDGHTWIEYELTEYTETELASFVSAAVNGRQELVWGGNSGQDNIGRVWRWTGSADELVGEADGEINAIIADTTGELGGGVFAVGDFRHINGVPALNVAHWDGAEWRPAGTEEQGNGARSPSRVLAVGPDAGPRFANRVFVAGAGDAGGQDCDGFATWDGSAWECIGNGGVENFAVRHMIHTEWDGRERIIVAGRVGPTFRDNGIAMWDGESWEYIPSPFQPTSHHISAFAIGELDGQRVMVLGSGLNGYEVSGGLFVFDGRSWKRFGKGFDEPPGSAVFFDDGAGSQLYVAGRFTKAGGRSVTHAARWDGRRWHPVGEGLLYNGYPQGGSLRVFDTGEGPRLYVHGRITHSGGTRLYNVGVWDGSAWKPVGTNLASWPPTQLFTLDTADGTVLAAIAPLNDDGVFVHRIMVRPGQQWQTLADGFNAAIWSAAVSPTNPRSFYLGGEFSRIGETPSDGFAEYMPALRLCEADFDCDGVRDTRDVVEYVGAWAAGEPRADIDGDGQVEQIDFILFLADWRFGC